MLTKNKILSLLGALLMSFAAPMVSWAENLNDALRWAYENNDELKAQRASIRAIKENVTQAASALLPTISLRGSLVRKGALATSYEKENGKFVPVTAWKNNDSASAVLNVTLLLYDGGKTEQAIEAAKADLRAAQYRLKANEQQVMLNTIRAYLDVLRDRELVAMSRNNIKVIDTQVSSAKVAYDSGAMTRGELSKTEAAAANARAALASAQARLTLSEEKYRQLTKHKPGTLAGINTLPKLPSNLEAAIAAAKKQSPLIAAVIETERSALYNLRRAERGRMPQAAIKANGIRNRSDITSTETTDSTSVELNIDVPLYQGGKFDSLERQARSNLEARANESNNTRALVEQNVSNAWATLESTRIISNANSQVVEAQRLADEGALVQYELGAITIVDKLEAEQDLISARANLLSAGYDQQYAAYQLLATIGALTIDNLGLGIKAIDPLVVPKPASTHKTMEKNMIEQISDRWSKD